jgi:hypothetical protein
MFPITSPENNKNGKILVCASPYAMFTRPPVDQCEMEDVNKWANNYSPICLHLPSHINQQVVVLIVRRPAAQTYVVVNVCT